MQTMPLYQGGVMDREAFLAQFLPIDTTQDADHQLGQHMARAALIRAFLEQEDEASWYKDLEHRVACDTCHKLVHEWATYNGYILCKDCFALESVDSG